MESGQYSDLGASRPRNEIGLDLVRHATDAAGARPATQISLPIASPRKETHRGNALVGVGRNEGRCGNVGPCVEVIKWYE